MQATHGQAGRKFILWCLLMMLAAGAAYAFAQSRYAQVDGIVVAGNQRLPANLVIETAGIRQGQSILSLRPGTIASRVCELPWVQEARLRWIWPNSVAITVRERSPMAIVPYHDRFLVLDREGRVLATTEEVGPWNLPLVTGPVPSGIRDGQFVTDPTLLGALHCLDVFPREWLPRVGEIHAEGSELVVYDLDGVPGFVGQADASLEARVRALGAVWADVLKTGGRAEYVDVRCVDRPIVKLVEGGGEGR